MSRKRRGTSLPAPYLKRIWLDARAGTATRPPIRSALPFLRGAFELEFERAVTIIVGENGTGKSTLLEGIAALAGYDEAGGGKGYMPVDHSRAIEAMGGSLGQALRASWLPKVTRGWFFRAESFFSVARYLDEAAQEPLSGPPPDFLSHSHGGGIPALLQGALRAAGLLHLRRAGVRRVAVASGRIPQADPQRMDHPASSRSSWQRMHRC